MKEGRSGERGQQGRKFKKDHQSPLRRRKRVSETQGKRVSVPGREEGGWGGGRESVV